MAGKGNFKFDVKSLSEIIVQANMYKQTVVDSSTQIRALCKQMEEEESLAGGDGEEFREAFVKLGTGMVRLEESISNVVSVLDEKLSLIMEKMTSGHATGSTTEDVAAASKKAGFMKKE